VSACCDKIFANVINGSGSLAKNRSLCERRRRDARKEKHNNLVDEVKDVCFHFVQASCLLCDVYFRLIPVSACIRARVLLMLIQMRRLNNFSGRAADGNIFDTIKTLKAKISWKVQLSVVLPLHNVHFSQIRSTTCACSLQSLLCYSNMGALHCASHCYDCNNKAHSSGWSSGTTTTLNRVT
jgi:hypothetical protein